MSGGVEWAVKDPAGKIYGQTRKLSRSECITNFVMSCVELGFVTPKVEWFGCRLIGHCWRAMRGHGYRVVRTTVIMQNDPKSGFSWPDCVEVVG